MREIGEASDPNKRATAVIGYFASVSRADALCTDGDACVIAGSSEAMHRYLSELPPDAVSAATVKKVRFADILRGLELGGGYAFDRESYSRFYPLASDAGIVVQPADFVAAAREGKRYITVRLPI